MSIRAQTTQSPPVST